MTPVIFSLAVLAFVISFLLTPLVRALAVHKGWVDRPDHNRKLHTTPFPRIGGVPVLLGYCGSLGILLVLSSSGVFSLQASAPLPVKLLPAILVVFLTGLIDDLAGLRPAQKLLGQLLAASLAFHAGVRIQVVGAVVIDDVFAVPFTILWLIVCTNAFNLIDGMDGLASGLGLLGSLTMLIVGLLYSDTGLFIAAAPLVGALLGFLPFNFHPASVFLGDCGSLWIGFLLGCFAVSWSKNVELVIGLAAPLIALSIPLLDTVLAIVRRYLGNRPVFMADRDHIHHRLLRRGLSQRRVAALLYLAASAAGSISVIQSIVDPRAGILLTALFVAAVWVGVRHLRYQEFGAVARWLRHNGLRSEVRMHLCLQGCQDALRNAANLEECWRAIRPIGRELGLSEVVLRLGGRMYKEQLEPTAKRPWTVHIPISDSEYVKLASPFNLTTTQVPVASLVTMLHQILPSKATEFRTAREPSQTTPPVASRTGRATWLTREADAPL